MVHAEATGVADKLGPAPDWQNDADKGFLSVVPVGRAPPGFRRPRHGHGRAGQTPRGGPAGVTESDQDRKAATLWRLELVSCVPRWLSPEPEGAPRGDRTRIALALSYTPQCAGTEARVPCAAATYSTLQASGAPSAAYRARTPKRAPRPNPPPARSRTRPGAASARRPANPPARSTPGT